MSRGLGWLQRRILAVLESDPARVWLYDEVAAEIYGKPSPIHTSTTEVSVTSAPGLHFTRVSPRPRRSHVSTRHPPRDMTRPAGLLTCSSWSAEPSGRRYPHASEGGGGARHAGAMEQRVQLRPVPSRAQRHPAPADEPGLRNGYQSSCGNSSSTRSSGQPFRTSAPRARSDT